MKKMHGFTLLELLITVAIMSIMVTAGLPSFQAIIEGSRLTSAANSMVSALQLARMEAIKQHKSVLVIKKTNWENGWNVFVDSNGDNSQDSTTEPTLTSFDKVGSAMTVKTSGTFNNYAGYGANGRSNAGGNFAFCSSSNTQDFRTVVVALTGRVHVETASNSTRTYASEC